MCRLFAVSSAEPVPVSRAFERLKRLSEQEHRDGWGIAQFDAPTPTIEVSLEPAHTCARFDELGRKLHTRRLLAHIRLASVGDVRAENAHPFFADGWAFMHNGTLRHFEKHRAELEAKAAPRWRARIRGGTDSERCFALLLTELEPLAHPSTEDVARALARVMQAAAAVCDHAHEKKKSAMNFLVSDGRRIVATRRGRSLFHARAPGAHYIASERLLDGLDWREVPEDGVVAVEEDLTVREWTVSRLLAA